MPRQKIEEVPNREYKRNVDYIRPRPIMCERSCLTIVLDLDETLIRTFDTNEKVPIAKDDPDYFSFYIDRDLFEGMKRPYLDDFISSIFRKAGKLVIFTAAKLEYANKVIDIIFRNHGRRPDKVFTYENCARENGELRKPIDLVFDAFPDTTDENRLIILDDKQSVYFSHDIKNVAQVKPFTGSKYDKVLWKARFLIKEIWNSNIAIPQRPEIMKYLY